MKASQLTFGLGFLVLLAGCSSGQGASTFTGPGVGTDAGAASGNGTPTGPDLITGETGGAKSVDMPDGATDMDEGGFAYNPNDPSGCAKGVQGARLSPVNLVFVYDKSGSMGDTGDGFDPAERWIPMREGMLSFFADPNSASLSATLSFFPVIGDEKVACTGPYDDPTKANPPGLPLMSLSTAENRAKFSELLTTTKPSGGTPTLPALLGGIAQAKKILTERPYEVTVVVLVTDGEPGFWYNGAVQPVCENNNIENVAKAAGLASSGSPKVPVYAIGVGPSIANLDTVAQAGGTGQATRIDGTAAEVSAKFRATLEAIRTQTFSCDFPIPPPPNGLVFDSTKVNVTFTTAAGTSTMNHSSDCAQPGWRYDTEAAPTGAAPTKISLCPATCNVIQQDTTGKIGIVFGCQTQNVPIH